MVSATFDSSAPRAAKNTVNPRIKTIPSAQPISSDDRCFVVQGPISKHNCASAPIGSVATTSAPKVRSVTTSKMAAKQTTAAYAQRTARSGIDCKLVRHALFGKPGHIGLNYDPFSIRGMSSLQLSHDRVRVFSGESGYRKAFPCFTIRSSLSFSRILKDGYA
jgi:hypothetical protein